MYITLNCDNINLADIEKHEEFASQIYMAYIHAHNFISKSPQVSRVILSDRLEAQRMADACFACQAQIVQALGEFTREAMSLAERNSIPERFEAYHAGFDS